MTAPSWMNVSADTDFSIWNFPFAIEVGSPARVVSRLGDHLICLSTMAASGLIPGREEDFLGSDALQWLAEKNRLPALRAALMALFDGLSQETGTEKEVQAKAALNPVADQDFGLPMPVRAFVDFYSGIHHASNVGRMFRPDQPPLLPNYRHIPIGYNGRASSVVPSGAPINRPNGQLKSADEPPTFGPSRELDFELEMGFFLREGSAMGAPVPITEVENHIAGLVIVNDWSARDIQRWEYQPLGPFLAKSFATSISPWLVLIDALEPFRIEGMDQDPAILPYLNRPTGSHFDIKLEVWLATKANSVPIRICESNMSHLYWSLTQQLAHQSSNGTPLESGDLYATGTISGPEENQAGSMLELSLRGQKPVPVGNETRTFLQDGDTVIMRAYAEHEGKRVGFGEVKTTILPAPVVS